MKKRNPKTPKDGQHRTASGKRPDADYQQAKIDAEIERAQHLLPAVLAMNTAACQMSGGDMAVTLLAVTRHLVRFMVNQGMQPEFLLPLLAEGAAEGQDLKDRDVDLHIEMYLEQAPPQMYNDGDEDDE